ncbi:MAG: phosphoribosylanthranilate isomerase [Egibacteraceae bacterium]
MFVKICGLRTPRAVTVAVDAGAEAVGFVLTASPRQLTPAQARHLAAGVPPDVLTVAVFSGEPPDTVRAAAIEAGVRAVQLHGDHPAGDFAALRDLPFELVRAVAGTGDADLRCGAYGEDLLIVDAPRPGSGELWSWGDLAGGRMIGRWLLAGGLRPDNVAAAIRAARPWGVDVSSGVESSRGVKDLDLIRRFVRAAKGAAC